MSWGLFNLWFFNIIIQIAYTLERSLEDAKEIVYL